MSRGIGVFSKIMQNIRSRMKMEYREQVIVGKDHLGNTYYETPADPARGIRKPKRWFEGRNDDSWSDPMPTEWEAWLRYRRDSPPSSEEVYSNLQRADQRRKMGQESSARLSTAPPPPSKSESLYERYPKYKDYESHPGLQVEKMKAALMEQMEEEKKKKSNK